MLPYLISSITMALAALLVFYYYWRKGQFDDMEESKYQLFWEEKDND
jgi:cbb3-type cytochrome oxidase maturation protein